MSDSDEISPGFLAFILRHIFPFILSAGTVMSAAGSSLFGTQKIIGYADDYFDFEDDTLFEIQLTLFTLVIVSNVIVMLDTRVPAIFLQYETHRRRQKEKATIEETLYEKIADELYDHPETDAYDATLNEKDDSDFSISPIDTNGPIRSLTIEVSTVSSRKELPRSQQFKAETKAREYAEPNQLPMRQYMMKKSVTWLLEGFGFCSMTFSALITFLGSKVLFEWIGGDPSEQDYDPDLEMFLVILMNAAAAVTVVSKFYSNYSYVWPSTKQSAKKMGHYAAGLEVRDEKGNLITASDALKGYGTTLAISSFNILSSPFLAFFTTQQTCKRIPFVQNYDDGITYFAALSTVTSFTNDLISKSPAVQKTIRAWVTGTDSDAKIQALNKSNFLAIKVLDKTVYVTGVGDSIATGANIMVSVIATSNFLFDWDKYNPYLFIFAATCGVSAAFVNFAFSVHRGHLEFKRSTLYPYYIKRGWLNAENTAITTAQSPANKSVYIVKNPKLDQIPNDILEHSRRKGTMTHSSQRSIRSEYITIADANEPTQMNGHDLENGRAKKSALQNNNLFSNSITRVANALGTTSPTRSPQHLPAKSPKIKHVLSAQVLEDDAYQAGANSFR